MSGERKLPLTESSSTAVLIEVVDTDAEPGDLAMTPDRLLRLMRERVKYYGSPVPEGYVPPPGIDLAELLRQVPWPPAA